MTDPLAQRQQEKQRSRAADAETLVSGAKTPEQLRQENGHFAGFNVRVAIERAKRLW